MGNGEGHQVHLVVGASETSDSSNSQGNQGNQLRVRMGYTTTEV